MMQICRAHGKADFEAARALIAEMALWDASETRQRGVPADDLLRPQYSDTTEKLVAKFTGPDAGLFVSRSNGTAAGCVGFRRSSNGIGEIQKMFVRPEFRGKGFGRTLMMAVIDEMRQSGYGKARLETVLFMTDAIALYRAIGFRRCDPFRNVLENLRSITIFMERELWPAASQTVQRGVFSA